MIYCVKCTECDYAKEVSVAGYSAYQEYLKKEKCPECEAKIEDDFATKIGSVALSTTMGTNRKRDAKHERATKRRKKAAMPKDPYAGFRSGAGDRADRKVNYDELRGQARSEANRAKAQERKKKKEATKKKASKPKK